MPLDLVITVMLIGLFHLAVGILIGRHLKSMNEPTSPMLRWGFSAPVAGTDLVCQLDSLVKSRLASAPNADLTERLSTLFEEIATAVEQSKSPTVTMAPEDAEQVSPDAAGIGSARWFPVTPLEGSPAGTELRRAKRFSYTCKQSVAPLTGAALPDEADFTEVLFRDISTNGFSFYTPEEFPVDRLMARLGTPPDTVTVLARVVRQGESWQDGQWLFHVGCEIERRLDDECDSLA